MSRIIDVYETNNSGWVTIEVIDVANESHYMDVKQLDLDAYEDGALIQDAFPYLTNEQREIILSGMTDDMWGDMFPGDEEEEQ
jgi:hypothetical protein